MKRDKFNTIKNRCLESKAVFYHEMFTMTKELQPYFSEQISVVYQPHIFVILHINNLFKERIQIDDAFKNISKDPEYYLK